MRGAVILPVAGEAVWPGMNEVFTRPGYGAGVRVFAWRGRVVFGWVLILKGLERIGGDEKKFAGL